MVILPDCGSGERKEKWHLLNNQDKERGGRSENLYRKRYLPAGGEKTGKILFFRWTGGIRRGGGL